jgi:hypothetical protein
MKNPCHSDATFWKQNIMRFEDKDCEVLKHLIQTLSENLSPDQGGEDQGCELRGARGGRPAPLASRLHRISYPLPIGFARDLMEVSYHWPPWLSESYHPRICLMILSSLIMWGVVWRLVWETIK